MNYNKKNILYVFSINKNYNNTDIIISPNIIFPSFFREFLQFFTSRITIRRSEMFTNDFPNLIFRQKFPFLVYDLSLECKGNGFLRHNQEFLA